jgi:hypothetical protein
LSKSCQLVVNKIQIVGKKFLKQLLKSCQKVVKKLLKILKRVVGEEEEGERRRRRRRRFVAAGPGTTLSHMVKLYTGILTNMVIHTMILKVRFHHHIFATNLLTNFLAKLPHKQMLHNFFIIVSQKFVANQICLPQTQLCEFVSEFVTKFVAKM